MTNKYFLIGFIILMSFCVHVNAQSSFGYLKIINNNPRMQTVDDSNYVIIGIFIKQSESSEWDGRDYLGGSRITRDNSTAIALTTGLYDIRFQMQRFYVDIFAGNMSDFITVESLNVPIRDDMITDIIMARGRFSVSLPRRE
ncbi:MAG: hypothetical protein FWD47_13400 [Treponema sp.]|nr:hypothetical protein [Treponema sp.]